MSLVDTLCSGHERHLRLFSLRISYANTLELDCNLKIDTDIAHIELLKNEKETVSNITLLLKC